MRNFRTYLVERQTIHQYKDTIEKFINNVLKKSLGVPRHKMPQIASYDVSAFKAYLAREYGVTMKKSSIKVKDIKFTQKEVNFDKIGGMIYGAAKESLAKPVLVSKDGYALDGHHRIAALWIRGDVTNLDAHVIDAPIKDILDMAKGFDKTFYKSIGERFDHGYR